MNPNYPVPSRVQNGQTPSQGIKDPSQQEGNNLFKRMYPQNKFGAPNSQFKQQDSLHQNYRIKVETSKSPNLQAQHLHQYGDLLCAQQEPQNNRVASAGQKNQIQFHQNNNPKKLLQAENMAGQKLRRNSKSPILIQQQNENAQIGKLQTQFDEMDYDQEGPIQQQNFVFSMVGEDDPTFRKVMSSAGSRPSITNNSNAAQNFHNKQKEDDLIDFVNQPIIEFKSQQMEIQDFPCADLSSIEDDDLILNEDLNKIKTDFAGDTFSQISSTFEPQIYNPPQNNSRLQNYPQYYLSVTNEDQQMTPGNNKLTKLAAQKTSQKKNNPQIYNNLVGASFKQKSQERQCKSNHSQQLLDDNQLQINNNKIMNCNKVIDELLDSDILNASNDDNLKSPNSPINGQSQAAQQQRKKRSITRELQQSSLNKCDDVENAILGLDNYLLQHQQNLNIQNSTSTLTCFNSAVFDDASIIKALDQTKSENLLAASFDYEENFFENEILKFRQLQPQMFRQVNKNQIREMIYKQECEEMKSQAYQIVQCLNKVKSQPQTKNAGASKIQIDNEEIKMLENTAQTIIQKIGQLNSIGVALIHENEMKNTKMKLYRQNLKLKLHENITKYKELCRRQWKGADNRVFKYQLAEFDQNQRIAQLEEKLERQQEEINKQANTCEQIRYQKKSLLNQYDQRMNDIESAIKIIIKNIQEENKAKISNSFSIGGEHSMLLGSQQPFVIQNVKNKYIISNQYMGNQQQPMNLNGGTNSMSSSNTCNIKQKGRPREVQEQRPRSSKLLEKEIPRQYITGDERPKNSNNLAYKQGIKKQRNGGLQLQLLELKNMIKDFKLAHQQQQQMTENDQDGSISHYYQEQALDHMLSHVMNIGAAVSKHPLSSSNEELSIDQAFIQQTESKIENQSQSTQGGPANFNFGKLLQDDEEENREQPNQFILNDMILLDDQITGNDLIRSPRHQNQQQNRQVQNQHGSINEDKKNSNIFEYGHILGSSKELHSINESSIDFVDSRVQNNVLDSQQKINGNANKRKNQSNLINVKIEGEDPTDVEFSDFLKNNNNQNISNQNGFLEFTGASLAKEIINGKLNSSLYSGGSSLIGLNYAFQAQAVESRPQENFVVKIQNREIKMPKIDIERVLSMENREIFKNNIAVNATTSNDVSSSMFLSQQPDPNNLSHKQSIAQLPQSIGKPNFGESLSIIQGSAEKSSKFNQNSLDKNFIKDESNNDVDQSNLSNMFQDFKQELEKSNDKQNDTLNLNESNHYNNDAQVLDMCMKSNQRSPSLFKKSLSDSNIIFSPKQEALNMHQDIQAFENDLMRELENSSSHEAQPIKAQQQVRQSSVPNIIAFKKIKIPQAQKAIQPSIAQQVSQVPPENIQEQISQPIKRVIPKGMKIKITQPKLQTPQNYVSNSNSNAEQKPINFQQPPQNEHQEIQSKEDEYAQILKNNRIVHTRLAQKRISTEETVSNEQNSQQLKTHKRTLALQKVGSNNRESPLQQSDIEQGCPVSGSNISPNKKNVIVVSKQLIKLPIKQVNSAVVQPQMNIESEAIPKIEGSIIKTSLGNAITVNPSMVRRFVQNRNFISQQKKNEDVTGAKLQNNQSMMAPCQDQSVMILPQQDQTSVQYQSNQSIAAINYSAVSNNQYSSVQNVQQEASSNFMRKIQGQRIFKMIKQQQQNLTTVQHNPSSEQAICQPQQQTYAVSNPQVQQESQQQQQKAPAMQQMKQLIQRRKV